MGQRYYNKAGIFSTDDPAADARQIMAEDGPYLELLGEPLDDWLVGDDETVGDIDPFNFNGQVPVSNVWFGCLEGWSIKAADWAWRDEIPDLTKRMEEIHVEECDCGAVVICSYEGGDKVR